MVDGGTNKDGAIGSGLVKKLRSGGCPALKPRFEQRIKDARGGAGSKEEWQLFAACTGKCDATGDGDA